MREEEAEFTAEEEQALLAVLDPLNHVRVSPDFLSRVLEKSGLSPIQPGESESIKKEFASANVTPFPAARKRWNWWVVATFAQAAVIVLGVLWGVYNLPLVSVQDAEKQYQLGLIYDREKDYAAAAEWYLRAAEQGFARAQSNLASLYEDGLGVPQDDTVAVNWYRKAAEQGFAMAQSNLGIMYREGRGIPQDDAAAAEWYRKAAKQGFARAQYNLALLYADGLGVPQDDVAEAKWYQKAAEQGFARAQNNLAVLYEAGRGVPQDDAAAAEWYRKAAEQGLEDAQNRVCPIFYTVNIRLTHPLTIGSGIPRHHCATIIGGQDAAATLDAGSNALRQVSVTRTDLAASRQGHGDVVLSLRQVTRASRS